MKCEWKKYKIGDLCSSISETYKGKHQYVVTINTSDVLDGEILNHSPIKNDGLKGQFKKTFQQGDILYSEIRPANRRFAFVNFQQTENYIASTKLMVIRANKNIVLPEYLFAFLKLPPVIEELQMLAETRSGTFPQITFSGELAKLKINLPDMQTQKKIVDMLRVLEDKIAINGRILVNIQQQAQVIFKSWFVDFEPFQGGEFVKSELGPIPKGWSVGRLANICTYGKDKVAVSELTPENYFSTENMLANKGGYTSAASLPNVLQTTRCVPGDTLVSNIRPYFKKIVYCTMKAGCSTDVLCLRPKHPQYSTYLYNLAYSDAFFDYMVAGSKGTKMPRGDKQQIMGYPVILPPDEVIAQFHEFADAVLKKNWVASEENKKLTVLRDSLLPKLMSGELFLNEEVGS